MRSRLRRDDGDIVLGWLTKTAVTIAVVGLVLFDSIAIFAGRMTTTDAANEVASAASDAWHGHPDVQTAYDAAVVAAAAHDGEVPTSTFTVDPNGTVHLQLRHHVTTLIAHRIGPLKKYTWVVESGQANSLP